MEFKGTKGKWRCVMPEGYGKSTLVMNGTDIICDMVKFEGKRYNALLISKAPEMLEMLINLTNKLKCTTEYKAGVVSFYELIKESEQLIKQATEL